MIYKLIDSEQPEREMTIEIEENGKVIEIKDVADENSNAPKE